MTREAPPAPPLNDLSLYLASINTHLRSLVFFSFLHLCKLNGVRQLWVGKHFRSLSLRLKGYHISQQEYAFVHPIRSVSDGKKSVRRAYNAE